MSKQDENTSISSSSRCSSAKSDNNFPIITVINEIVENAKPGLPADQLSDRDDKSQKSQSSNSASLPKSKNNSINNHNRRSAASGQTSALSRSSSSSNFSSSSNSNQNSTFKILKERKNQLDKIDKSVRDISILESADFGERLSRALGGPPLPPRQASVASERETNDRPEKSVGVTFSPTVDTKFLPKLEKIQQTSKPKKKEPLLSDFPEIFTDFNKNFRPELLQKDKNQHQPTSGAGEFMTNAMKKFEEKNKQAAAQATAQASNYISEKISETLAESRRDRQLFGLAKTTSGSPGPHHQLPLASHHSHRYPSHIFLDYETFPIYVETLTGTIFEVICSPYEPLSAIKDKIYRLENIPISKQHLIFRGEELKDNDQLIKHAGIKAESKVTLILDLRGGPMNSSSISRFPSTASFSKFYSTGSGSGSTQKSDNSNSSTDFPRKYGRLISETFENFGTDDSDDDEKSVDDDDLIEQSLIDGRQLEPGQINVKIEAADDDDDEDDDGEDVDDDDDVLGPSRFKSKHIDPLFREKAERWRNNDFSDNSDSEFEKLSNSEVYLHSYHNGNAVLVVFEKRSLESSQSKGNKNKNGGDGGSSSLYGHGHHQNPFSNIPNVTCNKSENRDALIKSATSLIDDTRLNIKMRNLKKKMQESKLKSKARDERRKFVTRDGRGGQQQQQQQQQPGGQSTLELIKDKRPSSFKLPELPKVGRSLLSANPSGFPKLSSGGLGQKKVLAGGTLNPPKPLKKKIVNHNHEKFCQKYNLTSPRSDEEVPIKRLDSGKRLSPKNILPPIDLRNAGYTPLDNNNIPKILPNSNSKIYNPPTSKFTKTLSNQTTTEISQTPKPPSLPKKSKPKKIKTKKAKCNICNKKINLGMEFTCRCGKLLCSQHRLPETHECSFDYKLFGKEVLKKENPVVAADKLSKFQ